jgi:hypothetical protein
MNVNRMLALLVVNSVVLIPNVASAFYAAHMGRWTTRDPYGEIGRMGAEMKPAMRIGTGFVSRDAFDPTKTYHDGMNLYQYVQSAPTTKTDPQGLHPDTGIPWFGPGADAWRDRPPSDCFENCLKANGVGWAIGVGIGTTPVVSLPIKPPGRPLGAPTPDYSTLLRKYGGKSCRCVSRRLNPFANAIAAGTIPYGITATLNCACICEYFPNAY